MAKFFHFVLKVVAGTIIFPLSVFVHYTWPWWQKTNILFKILTAIFILPPVGLMWMIGDWYNDLTMS